MSINTTILIIFIVGVSAASYAFLKDLYYTSTLEILKEEIKLKKLELDLLEKKGAE